MKEKDYHKRNFLKFPLISTQDEYDKKDFTPATKKER